MGFYAIRNTGPVASRMTVYMHREILGLTGKIEGDHKDGDGTNNQRANLRAASSSQNKQAFRTPRAGKSSKFRGVSRWGKGRWQAGIRIQSKPFHIGLFESEVAAAKAYDAEAVKRFGSFAKPNFPYLTNSGAVVA